MAQAIGVSVDAGVLTIRIARPEKKNALNFAMYDAIADGLEQADSTPGVRAVLISGDETCFTSGNDLSDFLASPPGREESPAGRFLRVLSTMEKPVVAAVAGPAIGVGTTMLFHCDLVYAAENAVFQLPFVNIGLVPEAGSTLLLPQLAGAPIATELLLLGEKFDAARALELRIVNAVVAPSELLSLARSRADAIAGQPAGAVRATKALLRRAATSSVRERMREEGDVFTDRLRSPEAIEAMSAFMEKRKPDFSRFD